MQRVDTKDDLLERSARNDAREHDVGVEDRDVSSALSGGS
jgi:hypothetical protein